MVIGLLAITIAVSLCLILPGCGAGPTGGERIAAPGCASGFNLLLITLDTTRADHLGCYGYEQAQTPAIDSLCEHGVVFEQAVASAPNTLPSHASLLTGLSPPAHGVRDNGTYRLGPEFRTLAEVLKAQDYDTAAFVSCFILDARFGLDQGFDLYDFKIDDDGRRQPNELRHERRASSVTDRAINWLQQRARSGPPKPFFAWVHYFDPHHPYRSPLMQQARFRGHPYDAEIAYVDLHLKRLLDSLDELDLRDNTLIVLASDHGEALREHQEAYHGIFIYESTVRVALVLSCPTLFEQPLRVSDRVVGLVDVMPTLEEMLGLPRTAGLEGESLIAGSAAADRAIYIESYHPAESMGCAPLFGLRRLDQKFILAPTPEYYDLRLDPGELNNIYDAASPRQAALKRQLTDMLVHRKAGETAGARSLSADERSRLESLGYLAKNETFEAQDRPDPKDQIAIMNQLTEVSRLAATGHVEQGLELAKDVARQCEGYAQPIHYIAWLYEQLGRHQEAAQVLQDYGRRYPSVSVFVHLAENLKALRRYDEFEQALQAAERVDAEGRGSIPMMRGDLLMEQGHYADALAQYEKAAAIDAERLGPGIEERLANARAKLHRP